VTKILHKVLIHKVQIIASIICPFSHRSIELMSTELSDTDLNSFRRNDDQKFSREAVITPDFLIAI